jgi:hypothetical protein
MMIEDTMEVPNPEETRRPQFGLLSLFRLTLFVALFCLCGPVAYKAGGIVAALSALLWFGFWAIAWFTLRRWMQ